MIKTIMVETNNKIAVTALYGTLLLAIKYFKSPKIAAKLKIPVAKIMVFAIFGI